MVVEEEDVWSNTGVKEVGWGEGRVKYNLDIVSRLGELNLVRGGQGVVESGVPVGP
jgi:hypothetical protein